LNLLLLGRGVVGLAENASTGYRDFVTFDLFQSRYTYPQVDFTV
jgi:hypothetical protein